MRMKEEKIKLIKDENGWSEIISVYIISHHNTCAFPFFYHFFAHNSLNNSNVRKIIHTE